MTESLVKLVARSGVYDYDRGSQIKRMAKGADNHATHLYSTNGLLSTALEDAGIDWEYREPFQILAQRINGIRNSMMMHHKGNVPVVQVCTFVDGLSEVLYKLGEKESLSYDFGMTWANTAQSLEDPRLVFYTVATWLGYVSTKCHSVKHKRYNQDMAKFFLNMIDGRPRRQYEQIRDAVKDLRLLVKHLGESRFMKNVERRFFDF